MTILNLRLAASTSDVEGPPTTGGVFATVRQVAKSPQSPSPRLRFKLTIPQGHDVRPAELDVPVGRYVVEAFLPSGDILSEEVDVQEQGPVEVVLERASADYPAIGRHPLTGGHYNPEIDMGPYWMLEDFLRQVSSPIVRVLDACRALAGRRTRDT